MSDCVQVPFTLPAEGSGWEFWGRMGDGDTAPPSWGARLNSESRCTECGGPFTGGQALLVKCAPDMAGTAKHRTCP